MKNKLIPYLHAASVACGGHYGDRDSISEDGDSLWRIGKKSRSSSLLS